MSREIAEQELCDLLYKKGVIDGNSDFKVRRLDFNSPFYCFLNNQIIGQVQYDGNRNKFYDFKGSHIVKRDKKRFVTSEKQEFSVIDYLKVNKRIKL